MNLFLIWYPKVNRLYKATFILFSTVDINLPLINFRERKIWQTLQLRHTPGMIPRLIPLCWQIALLLQWWVNHLLIYQFVSNESLRIVSLSDIVSHGRLLYSLNGIFERVKRRGSHYDATVDVAWDIDASRFHLLSLDTPRKFWVNSRDVKTEFADFLRVFTRGSVSVLDLGFLKVSIFYLHWIIKHVYLWILKTYFGLSLFDKFFYCVYLILDLENRIIRIKDFFVQIFQLFRISCIFIKKSWNSSP
jgi:hypothetical protein